MKDQTFDQDFVFFNILPYSPGEEKQLAGEAIEYTARTGNRNVLYSLTINPAGFPAMKKVHLMLESYRKLKAELQGSETRLGVLFQAVLEWQRAYAHKILFSLNLQASSLMRSV